MSYGLKNKIEFHRYDNHFLMIDKYGLINKLLLNKIGFKVYMRNIIIISFIMMFSVSCSHPQDNKKENNNYKPYWENNFVLSSQQKVFLDTLQYKTFLYFLSEINPSIGTVKDRSTDSSPASIAAMGFALPIWAIGAEKGWISRDQAIDLTYNMLNFLINSKQTADELSSGHNGFYYHFLDMKTGERYWNSELSSIDSGLLFCGMIFARQYYNSDSEKEKAIRDLATKLIARANYNFFTQKNDAKYPYAISMGWHERDNGKMEISWWGYTEALFLYIIASGMDMQHAKEAWATWLKSYQWREPYPGLGHVVFPALFAHQYSMLFLDMRGWIDQYMKSKNSDYFENSRRATYAQWNFAKENPNGWKGYDSLSWGWTASDGPGEKYNTDSMKFLGYAARGNAGKDSVMYDDGTIAPTAAGGSIPFAPEITIPTLIEMKQRYDSIGVWGKYGFKDSFNPTLKWADEDYLGIDQGPIVIMIENFYNNFVWKYFMKDEIVEKGLKILGFEKITRK